MYTFGHQASYMKKGNFKPFFVYTVHYWTLRSFESGKGNSQSIFAYSPTAQSTCPSIEGDMDESMYSIYITKLLSVSNFFVSDFIELIFSKLMAVYTITVRGII